MEISVLKLSSFSLCVTVSNTFLANFKNRICMTSCCVFKYLYMKNKNEQNIDIYDSALKTMW